uniref:Reticulocalbin-3 n=1 Tax=Ciona intestinalis TaxID=7719 RepID=F6XGI2_CIOIN|nr:calumenin-B [Ciona intestinalis]|eukprot:XP_002123414.1 calumenin-B [Ciona intestinalis]
MLIRCVVILLVASAAFAGVARQDRVLDPKLSDKEPGSPEYDHEAFLGKDQAEELDELPEEESKRRLGIIVDQVDKNRNGQVTETELLEWIKFTQKRYVDEDAEKQFKIYDKNNDNMVHWDEYKVTTFGFLEDDQEQVNGEDSESYRKMTERDHRRFREADVDKDDRCTKEEFKAFLHPEEFEHMRDLVARETLEDIDKNKDGFVDVKEYIGDMRRDDDEKENLEWVVHEEEQFKDIRDTNGDGKMDVTEIKDWILPADYDHASAEAKHLVYTADDDKDGELSKEEILNHHDTFVGSQATDWGEALKRHQEF